MAAPLQMPFESPVFGPRDRQPFAGLGRYSAESLHSDVFSRERTSAAVSRPGRGIVRVLIPLAGELTELIYNGPALPEWAAALLRSLPERWGTVPNWDGYGAVPTQLRLVATLLNALSSVMEDESTGPQITALADGGMQAEWHGFHSDLEIVVTADDPPSYFFFDRITSEEEEDVLAGNELRVRNLIGGLR